MPCAMNKHRLSMFSYRNLSQLCYPKFFQPKHSLNKQLVYHRSMALLLVLHKGQLAVVTPRPPSLCSLHCRPKGCSFLSVTFSHSFCLFFPLLDFIFINQPRKKWAEALMKQTKECHTWPASECKTSRPGLDKDIASIYIFVHLAHFPPTR